MFANLHGRLLSGRIITVNFNQQRRRKRRMQQQPGEKNEYRNAIGHGTFDCFGNWGLSAETETSRTGAVS
jgi:hypothetical protein